MVNCVEQQLGLRRQSTDQSSGQVGPRRNRANEEADRIELKLMTERWQG